ncbi:MAG TPA: hypothetical protein VGE34_01715 [Candidatus Saccharimonadales bacterium]
MSRDKLPSRPTSKEVDGAVLRLVRDEYLEQVSVEQVAASFGTVCAPMFWASKKALEEVVANNPFFYNRDARLRDIKTVDNMRMAEGLNPDESFWEYVERKNREQS